MRVLVTGATERYGRESALALEAAGAAVAGFVRDPDGPVARRLADRGVSLVRGRRDQLDHVEDALDGRDALVLVTGADSARARTEQGETLVRAADRAAVSFVVHVSVLNADARPGVPCVDTRASVDDALARRGIPHVSLRPGVPLDAFERARDDVERAGRLAFPLEGHARAAVTDPRDVGRVAAAAVATPDSLADAARVPVTAGTHSLYDIAGVLADVAGRDVAADPRPPTAAPRSRVGFYRWVNEGALLPAPDREAAARDALGVDSPSPAAYFERAGWG